MFEHQKHIEIERRVLKAGDDRTRAGLPPANPDSLRLIAAHDLERELDAKWLARVARRAAPPRPVPPAVRPAKPVARPLAAVKPPVPPYLAAERARALAIIAAAPAGADAVRDEAIASGASVQTFRGMLAGRAILDAMRRATN